MSYRLAVFTIPHGNRVASQPTFVLVTVNEGQRYLNTIKVFIFIAFNFSLATNEQTDPFIESGLLLIFPTFVTLCRWYTDYESRFAYLRSRKRFVTAPMATGYACVCIMFIALAQFRSDCRAGRSGCEAEWVNRFFVFGFPLVPYIIFCKQSINPVTILSNCYEVYHEQLRFLYNSFFWLCCKYESRK
jgi:hypothetical protein